jgi:DNA-binding GntR family transcriptional regulator
VSGAPVLASFSPARAGARISEQAYAELKEALLSGRYKAGERLAIDAIAAELGSSRQPVLDATRRLETEGLLQIVPQVGTRVVTVGADEVKDFFRFLASTEAYFTRLAAERGTEAEIGQLLTIVDEYPRPKGADTAMPEAARRYRHHNREFHSQIHQMARTPLVHPVVVGLWDKSDFYISALSAGLPFALREHEAVDEHRLIAEAIGRRDADAACRETVEHILSFAEALGSVAPPPGTRP